MNYLITGANRGIGFGIAAALARRGDHVFATARHPDEAEELRALADETGRVEIFGLEVDDPSSVEALARALEGRPIDVLVNNAGRFTHVGEIGSVDFDGVLGDFRVNAMGPLRVTDALIENVRSSDARVICNITSNLGSLAQNTSGEFYAYRASKAALNMITRTLAADLADQGITAFVLHPGWVKTDMGGENAEISRTESVAGIVEVLDGVGPEDSGGYLAWDGSRLPW